MNIESKYQELVEALSASIDEGRMPIFVTDDDLCEVEWATSILQRLSFGVVIVTESEIALRQIICCDEECALFSLTSPRLPGAVVRVSRRHSQDKVGTVLPGTSDDGSKCVRRGSNEN